MIVKIAFTQQVPFVDPRKDDPPCDRALWDKLSTPPPLSRNIVTGTNAATSTQPPLILSYKRGKYKLNLPLKGGGDVAAAERDTTFSFRPDHRLDIVKANIRVSYAANGNYEIIRSGTIL